MRKHLADLSYIGLSVALGGLVAIFCHKIFLNSDINQFRTLGNIFCTEIQTHVQVGGYRKATELLETKFRQENLSGSTFYIADGTKTYYEGKPQSSQHHKVHCLIDGKMDAKVHFLFFSKYLTAQMRYWFLYWGIFFISVLLFVHRKVISSVETYVSRIIGFSLMENLGIKTDDGSNKFKFGFIERIIDLNGHIFQKVKSDINSLRGEIERKSRALANSESEKMRLLTERAKNKEFLDHVDQVRHDISGPLKALQSVKKEKLLNPDIGPNLIDQFTERMGDVLSGLNGLKAEYEENQKTPLNVKDTIEELFTEKKVMLGKNSQVDFSCQPGNSSQVELKVDKSGFKRAVSNILDNSIEAIGSKSGKIKVKFFERDSSIKIRFLDNGQGIDQKVLPKLFQKGATFGKENGKGLGLFSVKKFFANYGGKVSIRSKLSWGTIIEISLQRETISS